mgnify:CR=1 FL=1
MKTYVIMAKMQVSGTRSIRANSLEEALQLSKKLKVSDFVQPAKGADNCFNDHSDFEVVYGVFADGD